MSTLSKKYDNIAGCSQMQREYNSAALQITFTPIGSEHIGLLRSFFERYPSRSCDFTIGGVLIWASLFEYSYAVIEDTLLIKGVMPDSGMHVFYAPCGEMDINKFRRLVNDYCLNSGVRGMIVLPEEETIGIDVPKESLFGEYMPEYKEYLYPIERFCGFPGKKMEKKRNHLHYFENHFMPCQITEITLSDVPDLIEFTRKFESEHQDSEMADYECRALIETLGNYQLYGFEGIVIRKDGEVVGFTFGEKSGDTFVIHAEKANIEYRGSYQAVSSALAEFVHNRYPEINYLNREDDMGDESLRQSKESYHPSLYIHKRRYFVR